MVYLKTYIQTGIHPKDEELSQFGHMCEDLGINIIATNTPQVKVEKLNNIIQNRLINDIIENRIHFN